MNDKQEEKNETNLSYPVAIVIFAVILVIGYGMIRANERKAVEKAQLEKQNSVEKAQIERQLNIENCESGAEDAYWSYMELNGTGKRYDKEGVSALTRFWDTAQENKQNTISNCFKKYEIK